MGRKKTIKNRGRIRRNSKKVGGDISRPPTFHVLIATGGRPELKTMIDSLKGQLSEKDAITIVFDGPGSLEKSTMTDDWTAGFKCPVKKIEQEPALGFWGHEARNKYQGQLEPKTTFVMHADDDDKYIENVFDILRKKCTDPNKLYVARITRSENYMNRSQYLPRNNSLEIAHGSIGTPCGIVPFDVVGKSQWGHRHGGDFDYFNGLQDKVSGVEYLSDVIYKIEGGGDENKIYTFWTGTNEMSSDRKDCLEALKRDTGCTIVFINPENLNEYILPDKPLHEAYKYLSETHKSDFLRTYFMHFYGGGYSDIKRSSGSWVKSFEDLKNSDKWICGYDELNEGGVAYEPVKDKWRELIGNCAYICKAGTDLTKEWYNDMITLLDTKLEDLKKNPSSSPQNSKELGKGYPIEWNEMLGRIFHRLIYKYKEHVLKDLPLPIFEKYRGGGRHTLRVKRGKQRRSKKMRSVRRITRGGSEQPKKVAIFFVGRVTAYQHVLPKLLEIKNSYNPVIFCSLNGDAALMKDNNSFIKDLGITEGQYNIEETPFPKWIDDCFKNGPKEPRPFVSMYYHMSKAFKLIEEYQRKNSVEFDCILYYRADIDSTDKLVLTTPEKNTIYISEQEGWGGYNDRMAYGDFDSMGVYCDFYSSLHSTFCNDTSLTNPESFLKKYLSQKEMKVNMIPYNTNLHPLRKG
jgi:hypothetical protein